MASLSDYTSDNDTVTSCRTVASTATPQGSSENKGKSRATQQGESEERKTPKRNYWWCPVDYCASGLVQKVGQHLAKVHKLSKKDIAHRPPQEEDTRTCVGRQGTHA